MVEVDLDNTREFNRVITSMLEEMIRVSEFSDPGSIVEEEEETSVTISIGFDELLENMTIQNIMRASMEEETNRLLKRNEDVELIFNDERYVKGTKDDTCCMCLTELENNEYIHTCKNCNNISHFNCMNEWLKRKVECPICRKSFAEQVILKDDFHKFIETELDI